MAINQSTFRPNRFTALDAMPDSTALNQGLKSLSDIAAAYAKSQTEKALSAQGAQQDKALSSQNAQQGIASLLKKKEVDAQGSDERLAKGIQTLEDNPKLSGVTLDENGAHLQRKDNSVQAAASDQRTADRRERLGLSATKNVTNDYNQLVGTSPARVLAAQAVMQALKDNDVTSLGRIKANLPKLEGENYKPSDAERELILQATGEGKVDKLKNFFGMSTTPMSAAQSEGLGKYAQQRLIDEQGSLDRGRNEVMKRWGGAIKSLGPDEMAQLEGSLGMGSGELVKHLQSQPALPQHTIQGNLTGGMGTAPVTSQIPAPQIASPQAIRVKLKSTGQTGSVPSNEFDPNLYDKL